MLFLCKNLIINLECDWLLKGDIYIQHTFRFPLTAQLFHSACIVLLFSLIDTIKQKYRRQQNLQKLIAYINYTGGASSEFVRGKLLDWFIGGNCQILMLWHCPKVKLHTPIQNGIWWVVFVDLTFFCILFVWKLWKFEYGWIYFIFRKDCQIFWSFSNVFFWRLNYFILHKISLHFLICNSFY